GKDQIWSDLQSLLEYQTDRDKFTGNVRYASVFGDGFEGIHTPFNVYRELAVWLGKVRQTIALIPDSSDLAQKIWKLPATKLRTYRGDNLAHYNAILTGIHNSIAKALFLLPNSLDENERVSPAKVRAKLLKAAQIIEN